MDSALTFLLILLIKLGKPDAIANVKGITEIRYCDREDQKARHKLVIWKRYKEVSKRMQGQ